jgi:tetratricopeptide (TPR) repeat protein
MEGIGMKKYFIRLGVQFIAISCIVTAMMSCASGPVAKNKSQALYGMIYDRDNRPVHNAEIYVNGKYMVSSDIQGHFTISQIRPKLQYILLVKKQNYEEVQMEISNTDPADVLYVRMMSGDQFLMEAEQALKAKNWSDTEALLARAQQAGADGTSVQYLQAILCFYRERYGEALLLLNGLTEKIKNAPYLYLFIADIYQYRLGNPEQARVYLRQFLEIRHDIEVRNRLRALEEI